MPLFGWIRKIEISRNKEKEKEINEYMAKEYYSFQNQLKSFVGSNQNSAALVMALGSVNIEQETDSYEAIIFFPFKHPSPAILYSISSPCFFLLPCLLFAVFPCAIFEILFGCFLQADMCFDRQI